MNSGYPLVICHTIALSVLLKSNHSIITRRRLYSVILLSIDQIDIIVAFIYFIFNYIEQARLARLQALLLQLVKYMHYSFLSDNSCKAELKPLQILRLETRIHNVEIKSMQWVTR